MCPQPIGADAPSSSSCKHPFFGKLRGITTDIEKVVKFETELSLLFMVSHLVYKFQTTCIYLRVTYVIEQKPQKGHFLLFNDYKREVT